MYHKINPNPDGWRTGDCVVRAICIATHHEWEYTYMDLVVEGLKLHDMPSANWVWGSYLQKNGWTRSAIPNTCPACYTVRSFCEDHPDGTFILSTGTHTVAVIDGDYYDAWDSGEEVPIYYWSEK